MLQPYKQNRYFFIADRKWDIVEMNLSYDAPLKGIRITDAKSCYDVFMKFWNKALINVQEQFLVMYILPAMNRIVLHKMYKGTENDVIINPYRIVYMGTFSGASDMIVSHNHPEASSSPSPEDILTTEKIKKLADSRGITLIDHIILGSNGYYSFADNGKL
jgi:DNA repair protein RadC